MPAKKQSAVSPVRSAAAESLAFVAAGGASEAIVEIQNKLPALVARSPSRHRLYLIESTHPPGPITPARHCALATSHKTMLELNP